MEKKPSWDDIPSLDLSLESEEDVVEKTRDHRSAVRMVSRDILKMMRENSKVIYVRVATRKGVLNKNGILQDINQGGLCFLMAAHGLHKNDTIKIGAMLGKHSLKTNAIVRWATKDQVGVEYVDPKPEDVTFLAELYSAKILNRV
jgi:hypothetical protein